MASAEEFGLQQALWTVLSRRSRLVIPNFTPEEWFEADLWMLDRNNTVWEFEIKATKSDFRKDAAKVPGSLLTKRGTLRLDMQPKYARLADGHWRGPHHFVFVAPPGVIPVDEVPVWAGLWEIKTPLFPKIERVLKSPRLHKVALPQEEEQRALKALCHRFWNLRAKQRQ